jgi:hypothetical protein
MNYQGSSAAIRDDKSLMNNGYLLRSVLTAELGEIMRAVIFEDIYEEKSAW